MKRFSAKHIARWNRFKANGFERASSMKEHLKLLNVKDLWDKIGRREISLYEYMVGMSLVYKNKQTELEKRFGALDSQNDTM